MMSSLRIATRPRTPLTMRTTCEPSPRGGMNSTSRASPSFVLISVSRIRVCSRYLRVNRASRSCGAMSQRPCSGVPSSAAKQASESNRGQQSQSIEPSRPTISQPFSVAYMVEAAGLKAGDRALEIGTGSGYAAAVMAAIAARVYTIERHPALANAARRRLRELGFGNVEVRVGDGTLGWPEAQPFDAIIVTAGGPKVPAELREQLAIGGRLVIPVR